MEMMRLDSERIMRYQKGVKMESETRKAIPENCFECSYFKNAVYGKCEIKEIWYGIEDWALVRKQRPTWCPLETESTEKPTENPLF